MPMPESRLRNAPPGQEALAEVRRAASCSYLPGRKSQVTQVEYETASLQAY